MRKLLTVFVALIALGVGTTLAIAGGGGGWHHGGGSGHSQYEPKPECPPDDDKYDKYGKSGKYDKGGKYDKYDKYGKGDKYDKYGGKDDGDDRDCPKPPDEGCTPGYWKNHTGSWSGYSTGAKFNTVFGVNYNSSLTLLNALKLGGGGFEALARHATAALLNAAHSHVDYGLTQSQIIALVKNAFATNNPEPAKNKLDELNNAGCSIDAHNRPNDR